MKRSREHFRASTFLLREFRTASCCRTPNTEHREVLVKFWSDPTHRVLTEP